MGFTVWGDALPKSVGIQEARPAAPKNGWASEGAESRRALFPCAELFGWYGSLAVCGFAWCPFAECTIAKRTEI